METIIQRIERGHFWKFHGGIHPPQQKFFTDSKPIRSLALPESLTIPLQQHIGQAGKLIVKEGDFVLKGQPLTRSSHSMAVPVHAPTSGHVARIEEAVVAHPSGFAELCLVLTPDGNDTWRDKNICPDYKALEKTDILEKIANAGISGMGGAGFPTHVKIGNQASVDFLIINAAECEPYITADDLLMQEQTSTIIDGIDILKHVLSPKIVLIGIEDNKPKAIKALQAATKNTPDIKVCVLPTVYPSGGEKQLIKILTGKEVPSGKLPIHQGIVMQNVATCYAIADAVINDTPLIKRVVTVSGRSLEKPQNVWALLGTQVGFLLNQCGYKTPSLPRIIMGGPMMGFSLPSVNVPIVKTTNCILAPSETEISAHTKEVECIRCGQCAEACPANLLPQELQWSAKAKDHDQLEALNLFDCIECGACAYVCPSQIPLVHYYRIAKAESRQKKQLDIKAEKAKVRFEARKARLERDKKAREEKHRLAAEARKARMNAGTPTANAEKSAVAAALARVKAKKAQTAENTEDTGASPEKSQVAAAIARAKAKKAAKANSANQQNELEAEQTTNDNTPADDKKSKVKAAIAKAKAKKIAENATSDNASVQDKAPENIDDGEASIDKDDKKARVAAAIAKAKAKKLAAKAEQNSEITNSDSVDSNNVQTTQPKESSAPEETVEKTDDKKARVAAAVAKAKAKKLAAKSESTSNNEEVAESSKEVSTDDEKKARIAAAVAKAKAKAKKLAAKSESTNGKTGEAELSKEVSTNNNEVQESASIDTKASAPSNDDKKARIAAAVAKAKAKKQQRKEST